MKKVIPYDRLALACIHLSTEHSGWPLPMGKVRTVFIRWV